MISLAFNKVDICAEATFPLILDTLRGTDAHRRGGETIGVAENRSNASQRRFDAGF